MNAVLRALPLKRLILSAGVWWGPVVGTELPVVPIEALRAGPAADVPLLVGGNRDEGVLHTAFFEAVSAEDRDGFVRDGVGDAAVAPVADRYPRSSVKESLTDIMSDGAFACQARRAAGARRSRRARLPLRAHASARQPEVPPAGRDAPGGAVARLRERGGGDRAFTRRAAAVSRDHGRLGTLRRTGDPAGPALRWPRYTTANYQTAVLDMVPTVVGSPRRPGRHLWTLKYFL